MCSVFIQKVSYANLHLINTLHASLKLVFQRLKAGGKEGKYYFQNHILNLPQKYYTVFKDIYLFMYTEESAVFKTL